MTVQESFSCPQPFPRNSGKGGRYSSRGGRDSSYEGRGGRGGYNPAGRGTGGGRGPGRGHGGDTITFSVCKFYAAGNCDRAASCRHRHAVQKVSEAVVSEESDGFRGAVRSLVQWKDKPDHVFSACDDGTVKMWSTTDGSTWTQVTSVQMTEWRHVGDLQEVEGVLYVGYGTPYAHLADVTVDTLRVMDLTSGSTQEVVSSVTGFAHASRINRIVVVKVGAESRVYSGDEEGRITAWARPSQGAPFAQLAQLEGHARAITSLVSTASNGMLWSSSEDGTIRIWNTGTNACEHTITKDNGGHEGPVAALAIGQSAAEGNLAEYVISGSKDGTMGVFQAADGGLTYKHKCGTGVSAIAAFDPTPGTSALLLVGYEDGTIAVRNFPEFALAFEIHPTSLYVGHLKPVLALLPFNNPSIDDSYFLSAGEDGTMMCWNVHKLTDPSTAK
ncbi:unnamed protein product [Ectocarpus sp. 4 AP-2014]